MATMQQRRAAPIVEAEPEDRPASPTAQLDQGRSIASEREWLIFQPAALSSPSIDSAPSSAEPLSSASEGEWHRIAEEATSLAGGPGVQIGSLPAHDGQGIFPMDESTAAVDPSLYASAHAEWAMLRAVTPTDSGRLSFSPSDSSAELFRPSVLRRPSSPSARSASSIHPLTEHALASVPDNRPRRAAAEAEAEAALTSESELSDVEDLLSRTPQAASAGINTTPRARHRLADHAGLKRRHRKSGVSDKGSKRSNTSSIVVAGPQNAVGLPEPVPERRRSDPAKGVLLGQVVRKVFSVDEDLLALVATSAPISGERDSHPFAPAGTTSAALPRSPPRQSRFRRRLTLEHQTGMSAFVGHLRGEIGDFSGYAAGMTDSGEETEVDAAPTPQAADGPHRPHRQQQRPSGPPDRAAALHRLAETSPARSMSLSSLPHLLDSIYSSLPSELFQSTGPAGRTSPMRRSASLNEPAAGPAATVNVPHGGEPAQLSWWRALLQRIREGSL